MRPRAIETQDRQCVDPAVDICDPLFQHVEQVERRNFARIELFDDRACRLADQTLISHLRFSHFTIMNELASAEGRITTLIRQLFERTADCPSS